MKSRRLVHSMMLLGFVMRFLAGCSSPAPTGQPQILLTHPPEREEPSSIDTTTDTPHADGTSTVQAPTQGPTSVPAGTPEVGIATQGKAVAMARRLLAERLGVDQDEIQVQKVTRRDWPDTSLGCPQKGMMYARVVTPGYRVWLQVGNKSYDVHTGNDRAVVCENTPENEPSSSGALAASRAFQLAREDLATRLNVSAKEIEGGTIKPKTCVESRKVVPPAP